MKTRHILTAILFFLLHNSTFASADIFPAGFYGLREPEQLVYLKEAGFNSFQTYLRQPEKLSAMAEKADELGLKMIPFPFEVMSSSFSSSAAGWPVLAWFLTDEPDVTGIPPSETEKMASETAAWDARRPSALVISKGISAFTYGGYGGPLMVDWYPVPHLPLESVGRHVALARLGLNEKGGPDKPLWAVIQAFDWMDYPQRRTPKVGRFPKAEELRFMTWLSVIRGARGIFFFKYTDELRAEPARWRILSSLARELQSVSPWLMKGGEAEVPGWADGLAALHLKLGGRSLLILANSRSEPVPLESAELDDWRPLNEKRRSLRLLLPGRGRPELPPYRVLLLEK